MANPGSFLSQPAPRKTQTNTASRNTQDPYAQSGGGASAGLGGALQNKPPSGSAPQQAGGMTMGNYPGVTAANTNPSQRLGGGGVVDNFMKPNIAGAAQNNAAPGRGAPGQAHTNNFGAGPMPGPIGGQDPGQGQGFPGSGNGGVTVMPGGWGGPQAQPTQAQGGPAPIGAWNPTLPQGQQGPVNWQMPSQSGGVPDFLKPEMWDVNQFNKDAVNLPNYINTMLPVAQFAQNQYQYAQDAAMAQQRWQQEFGHTQNRDQYQMGLSTRQQQMAEWQAQQAAGQWDRQFAHTQAMDQAGLGLQQQGLGLQQQQINQQGQLNQGQINYWQGQVENQGYANTTDRMNVTNQFNLGQQANQNQATQIANQYALGQGQNANQRYATETQYQLGLQQNAIEKAYNEGRISNEQRGLALAELTQQQQNAFLYAQMAQQAQQAQLDRENAIAQANIGAFGRRQAPAAASWARGWS